MAKKSSAIESLKYVAKTQRRNVEMASGRNQLAK
jgi:hypothetical protein